MGFLQNDTNDIIIDTVLTDLGRQFLSRNDGSFSITKFAFGDDEVDYTNIRKYGRTVGKEKIEKNTPVFEALTNQNFALKNRMISVSNPNLLRLPTLDFADTGLTADVLTMPRSSIKSRTLTVSQTIQNEDVIELLPGLFVGINNICRVSDRDTHQCVIVHEVSFQSMNSDFGENGAAPFLSA